MTMRKIRRPSPAMVIALLALFVAMAGTGYAAVSLPKNSVGPKQIKGGAVNSRKVKDGTLLAADFKSGQLPAGAQGLPGPRGIEGPRGADGPQGAKGTPGAPGATHVVTRTQQVTGSKASQAMGAKVYCQAGERATGGGLQVANIASYASFRQEESNPVDDGKGPVGWHGVVLPSVTDPSTTLIVSVICVSP
jgi:hypothetical protein